MLKRNLPIDPDELMYAFQIGNAAGSQQMPIENVENRGLNIFDEETGDINEIRLSDNPINRFGSAIAQEYGGDESKFHSIMNRLMALMRIISNKEKVEKYLKPHPDDEYIMVNNVLVEVMADFPMTGNGEIDEDQFFIKVDKILEKEQKEKDGEI